MSNSSNNKRIAKNTLFLYLRMIVVIIIGYIQVELFSKRWGLKIMAFITL